MSIIPGQVVYLPFSLSEAPDSLPTVAAYKRGVDGTFATQGGMSPTVVNVSGLAYYASAIIPTDAEPGDGYTLMVSVTVGGEVSPYWLDCGVVGYPGLTDEQATWLEETHEKAMLIGTGQAFVEVINPVGPGGKITLYSGYDYTSATTPISLPGATVDDATAVTLHAVPDRYGDEGEAIDLTGTVAGGEYVLEATRSQIPVSRAGQYRYQVWADDGGDHALLAAGTLVIARGK